MIRHSEPRADGQGVTGKTVTAHVVTGTALVTVIRDETVTGVTKIVTTVYKRAI